MVSGSFKQITIPVEEQELIKLMENNRLPIPVLKFDFLNTVHFRLFGYTKVGSIPKGPKNKADVFLFKCDRHGFRLSTPSGWANQLVCDSCLDEIKNDFKKLDLENDRTENKTISKDDHQLKKYLSKNIKENK